MGLQTPNNYLPYFNFRDWEDGTTRSTQVLRCGDLSVVVWPPGNSNEEESNNTTEVNCETVVANNNTLPALGFCHLESLIPFTDAGSLPVLHAYEGALGIFLALQHLNTGNGSIIDQVEGLNETCRIRFPTEHFFDTQYNAQRTFEHVDQQTTTSEKSDRILPFLQPHRPTAFLGGFSSSVTALAAYLSSIRGIVQVSGQGTSSELDNKSDYPLFVRSIPNEEYAARDVLLWWILELKLTHLAVIHTNDMHGRAYARSLRTHVRQLQDHDGNGPNQMDVLYISMDEDGDNIPEVLDTLKTSQFRYVFGILQHQHLYDMLMEAAYHRGLAGNEKDEYNWFFSDTFRSILVNDDHRTFPKGSPLHLAYRGVGFISPAAFGADTDTGVKRNKKFEIFEDGIRAIQRSPQQIEYLRTILPVDNETGTIPFVESSRNGLVYDTASFLYEAT
jgi:Receptor family ligand binding region